MGSLHSPPSPTTAPPSPDDVTSRSRVYALFSSRENSHSTNFSSVIGCYDPSNNTWSYECLVPDLAENYILNSFAMISLDGSIYIIGGRLSRKINDVHSCEQLVEIDLEVRSSVLRYNVNSKMWSTCASLNTPRYDFACDVCDDKIYVAGGQSSLASARGVSYAEVYDPLLDKWTTLPNMNTSRYKCVAVTWKGKFHVVGGFAISGTSDGSMPYIDRSSAEVYDTESRKWDLVPRMWQLDIPPNQIVAVEGKLFSSGDCLNAWKGQIEAYDGNLKIWYIVEGSQKRSLASPLFSSSYEYSNGEPIQRIRLTMAPIGTHLYILAGYRMAGEEESTYNTVSMVHRFDTSAATGAWRSFEPIQLDGERELCSHCCVVKLS